MAESSFIEFPMSGLCDYRDYNVQDEGGAEVVGVPHPSVF